MIEPLYCTQCGAEDWGCQCTDPHAEGPHCELTGRQNCNCIYCEPEAVAEDEEE